MGIFSGREPVDPPGGWFYDKPLPFSLSAQGETAVDEDEEDSQ